MMEKNGKGDEQFGGKRKDVGVLRKKRMEGEEARQKEKEEEEEEEMEEEKAMANEVGDERREKKQEAEPKKKDLRRKLRRCVEGGEHVEGEADERETKQREEDIGMTVEIGWGSWWTEDEAEMQEKGDKIDGRGDSVLRVHGVEGKGGVERQWDVGMAEGMAMAYEHGADVDWQVLCGTEEGMSAEDSNNYDVVNILPKYAFEPTRYWPKLLKAKMRREAPPPKGIGFIVLSFSGKNTSEMIIDPYVFAEWIKSCAKLLS
jgi:hypothetical protein